MFSGLFKNSVNGLDGRRKVVIDLEYISNCQSVVELTIVDVANDPTIIFYRRFNPFKESEFKVNPIASGKTKIPEERLQKVAVFKDSAEEVRQLINGSDVYFWGGNDFSILSKMFEKYESDKLLPNSVIDLMGTSKIKPLEACYTETIGAVGVAYNSHCSRVDALMTAYIYRSKQNGLLPNKAECGVLEGFIREKNIEALLYEEELKAAKRAKPANDFGQYKKLGWKIYFSRFSNAEKRVLKAEYSELGFHIMSGKSPNLTYIIFPDSLKDSLDSYEYEGKCVTLSDFKNLLKKAS